VPIVAKWVSRPTIEASLLVTASTRPRLLQPQLASDLDQRGRRGTAERLIDRCVLPPHVKTSMRTLTSAYAREIAGSSRNALRRQVRGAALDPHMRPVKRTPSEAEARTPPDVRYRGYLLI
jgi:hypothetical protein